MKKLLAVLLVLCLLPWAVAEDVEEKYFPFGITEGMTFQQVLDRVLILYETEESRVFSKNGSTYVLPVDCVLFDTPIYAIIVSEREDGGFSKITVWLRGDVKNDGVSAFFDTLLFLEENVTTELWLIEPSTVSYDLNGNPIQKTFLDDLDAFIDDYLNKKKEMDYMVGWDDVYLKFTKDAEKYEIRMLFMNKADD